MDERLPRLALLFMGNPREVAQGLIELYGLEDASDYAFALALINLANSRWEFWNKVQWEILQQKRTVA